MARDPVVQHHIDAADRINFIDEAWIRSAQINGAPVLPTLVLGREVWDFIFDAGTVELYLAFVTHVREYGEVLRFPFRCDGPTVRRWLTMELHPLPQDGVAFLSRTVREERRPALSLLDPYRPRSAVTLAMCSFCKRVELPPWVEAEEAVQRLRLFDSPDPPRLNYVICDDDRRKLEALLSQ